MIKAITVVNPRGESLRMELEKPEESRFLVINVDGLGPVQATINTTEVVSYDGSIFNSARGSERNIVFSLVFDENYDVEETRHETYRYFPLKQEIEIVVETDKRICRTRGYVESNEPVIFAQQENASISVLCPNSWFEDAGEDGLNLTNFYGIDPMFEFPFSNESLSYKLIEFGSIRQSFQESLFYYGEVETGFTMTIHATGDVGDITIHDIDTGKSMTVYSDKLESLSGSSLSSGDDIVICTVKGSKSAQLLRAGKYTNVLNCLGRDTDWFQLHQGENIFGYEASYGSENIQFSISVQNLFQGV